MPATAPGWRRRRKRKRRSPVSAPICTSLLAQYLTAPGNPFPVITASGKLPVAHFFFFSGVCVSLQDGGQHLARQNCLVSSIFFFFFLRSSFFLFFMTLAIEIGSKCQTGNAAITLGSCAVPFVSKTVSQCIVGWILCICSHFAFVIVDGFVRTSNANYMTLEQTVSLFRCKKDQLRPVQRGN